MDSCSWSLIVDDMDSCLEDPEQVVSYISRLHTGFSARAASPYLRTAQFFFYMVCANYVPHFGVLFVVYMAAPRMDREVLQTRRNYSGVKTRIVPLLALR